MSSPTNTGILTRLTNWIYSTPSSDEEQKLKEKKKDKELFGPLVILELAIRVLYPDDADVKYYIDNYRLCPQDLVDYKYLGFNTRKFYRMWWEPGSRNDLGLLAEQVDEFIEWYLIDLQKANTMGNQVKQLLELSKKGLIKIAEHPKYKSTNTETLVTLFVKKVENAIKGNFVTEKNPISDFGGKARELLNPKNLEDIMQVFNVALNDEHNLEYLKATRNKLEIHITEIQDKYIQLIKEATSKTLLPLSRKNSLNEGKDDDKKLVIDPKTVPESRPVTPTDQSKGGSKTVPVPRPVSPTDKSKSESTSPPRKLTSINEEINPEQLSEDDSTDETKPVASIQPDKNEELF